MHLTEKYSQPITIIAKKLTITLKINETLKKAIEIVIKEYRAYPMKSKIANNPIQKNRVRFLSKKILIDNFRFSVSIFERDYSSEALRLI
jgi:hypothetical protein